MMAVAAYTLLGKPAQAMDYLERHFGKAGPRHDHSQLFSYVKQLVNG
jgi:hypothetical protein